MIENLEGGSRTAIGVIEETMNDSLRRLLFFIICEPVDERPVAGLQSSLDIASGFGIIVAAAKRDERSIPAMRKAS
jgi:hypothetical protein